MVQNDAMQREKTMDKQEAVEAPEVPVWTWSR
jgi:hypothetical protein